MGDEASVQARELIENMANSIMLEAIRMVDVMSVFTRNDFLDLFYIFLTSLVCFLFGRVRGPHPHAVFLPRSSTGSFHRCGVFSVKWSRSSPLCILLLLGFCLGGCGSCTGVEYPLW